MNPTTFSTWVAWVWSRLPVGWFPSTGPIINAVIGAISTGAAQNYTDSQYMIAQTRIASATGFWLDAISIEMFGLGNFPRRSGELDPAFSARIQANLLRPLATRAAMISALTNLTGVAPVIFEPIIDACSWDFDLVWDQFGKLGSYDMPFTAFVDVALPQGVGFELDGWDDGAWDQTIAFGDARLFDSAIATNEVFRTVRQTQPAGTTVWVRTWEGQIPAYA